MGYLYTYADQSVGIVYDAYFALYPIVVLASSLLSCTVRIIAYLRSAIMSAFYLPVLITPRWKCKLLCFDNLDRDPNRIASMCAFWTCRDNEGVGWMEWDIVQSGLSSIGFPMYPGRTNSLVRCQLR